MKFKYFSLISLALVLASCGGAPATSGSNSSGGSTSTSGGSGSVAVYFYTDPTDTSDAYNTQNVQSGDLLSEPMIPTSSDPAFDVFDGWSTSKFASSSADCWSFATDTVPSGISELDLYAQWSSSGTSSDPSTSEGPSGDTKTIYLNPDIWATDSPKYYAWVWGGSDEGSWVDFVAEGSLYKISITATHTGIIFLRAGSAMEHGWTKDTNFWNKTGNETINYTNNVFTVTSWSDGTDGNSTGTWGAKS